MKLAATPEQQREWMRAWELAGEAIEEQRQRELFGMSENEAQRRSEDMLSLPEMWRRHGEDGAGLVEQQAYFSRWSRR